jgi:MEMO1 family protein
VAAQEKNMTQLNARKAAAAGTLYPVDPAILTRRLSELFAESKGQRLSMPPLVVIAPHSEMELSGAVAASAIGQLVGHQYDSIVVIAPTHRGFFPGASIYDGSAYQTPLGDIPLDNQLVEELTSLSPQVKKSSLGHAGKDYADEFSLEALLPHLQLALGVFSIIPIVTGDQEISTARALGDCLYSCLKKRNALIVVSTDLSHYHDIQSCGQLDARTRDTILALDAEGLINLFLAKKVEACGMVGLIAAMFFARRIGYDEVREMGYTQSAVSENEMIGHSGIVITRSSVRTQFFPARDQETKDSVAEATGVSEEVRVYLRRIASDAILAKEEVTVSGGEPSGADAQRQLLENRGVFVSLYQDDKLVGRAGYLRSSASLAETVSKVARSAFVDSSQTPDQADESLLSDYQILVHLLTPLRRIHNLESFNPSTQGAMVKLEMTSAYMFPDEISRACNSPEPSVENALGAVCLKAKLPVSAFADDGAEVYVFDIESF